MKKTNVQQLVNTYNLDGLVFDLEDLSSLEEIVVDVMLVKPYLVSGIMISSESIRLQAKRLLENDVVDLQLSAIDEYAAEKPLVTVNEPAPFPDNLKKIDPEQVLALNLSAFFPENPSGHEVQISGEEHARFTDAGGWLKFICSEADTLELTFAGNSLILPMDRWALPYKYIINKSGETERPKPWLEFRNMPGKFTRGDAYEQLCRTDTSFRAFINGEETRVYKTGVFFQQGESGRREQPDKSFCVK